MLFFVGGDPTVGEAMAAFPGPVGGFARIYFPVFWTPLVRPKPPDPPEAAWRLPAGQIHCLEMLAKVAGPSGPAVRVIDVNRPGDDRDLVTRWVGSGDVLPVAVREDGSRLVGEEAFTPAGLRTFLTTA